MTHPDRMTVRELAAYLGISEMSAYRGLEAGQLPGRRCGALWLINRQVVERWWAAIPAGTPAPECEPPSPFLRSIRRVS